jgi:hypothetical protein
MIENASLYREYADVPLNISEELVGRANSVSQFDAGLVIKGSHESEYQRFFETFPDRPELTQEQREYLLQRAAAWRTLIESSCNEELRRRANFVPVNVAGPSNYPAERMRKQTERDFKNRDDWCGKMTAFIENTGAQLDSLTPLETVLNEIRKGKRKGETFSADDPDVVDKLLARLDYLTAKQKSYKAMNAYYRKHKTMKGFEQITDFNAELIDKKIKETRYSWEQQPFPSYELTSINGKIKRVKSRIDSITVQRTEQPIQGYKFEGGEVTANYDENRLQVIFEGKPDESTRKRLKENGWHWSPRNIAWQRQLTKNALHDAKLILKPIGGNEDV